MRLRLLVLAVVLAGCVFPEPTQGPQPQDDPPHLVGDLHPVEHPDAPCPAPTPPDALPPDVVPAPAWREGQWWNYTMRDEAGVERGHALYEVQGCADLRGILAYRVRETIREWGHPAGLRESPTVRERFFETATLHTVWDGCGGLWPSNAPCRGRVPEWDLPLAAGKNWSYACCSDLPVPVEGRAERLGEDLWRVDVETNGYLSRRWTYVPSLGLFTHKEGGWGNGPGSWTLRAHGEGPMLPPAWNDKPRVTLLPACVPREALPPFASAPVRQPWEASIEGLMTRLAAAVQDPLVGSPWRDEASFVLRWNTTKGQMRVMLEGDRHETPTILYESDLDLSRHSPERLEAWVRDALQRFAFLDAVGVQVEAERGPTGVTAHWRQEVEGRPVLGSGGSLATHPKLELSWGPLHLLSDELPFPETSARAAAVAYAGCVHTAAGHGSAPFVAQPDVPLAVAHGSLTYRVHVVREDHGPGEHRCSGDFVHVDTQTGGIVGREQPPCF